MNIGFNIVEIKNEIHTCVMKGASAQEVLRNLYLKNKFIAKESVLWDYKEELENDELSLAKAVKQISSFHNSFGGYIIYGVREQEKDKVFIPIDTDLSKINISQLKNLINNYLDTQIDITYSTYPVVSSDKTFNIGVLHIPQRVKDSTLPVKFIKNSPKKKTTTSEKNIFLEGDVYLRKLDDCKKATASEDWRFLFSPRTFMEINNNTRIEVSIDHNLPERKIICPKFIGRESILSILWEWLSDPLEYTKVLAGDGGKGKTSIAYNFCQQFLESPPAKFERVLWLGAKEKQFSGFDNRYFDLQEVDFTDFNSFLVTLSEHCALDVDLLESTSVQNIKLKLRSSLPIFPSLIIIDNVDSLEQGEQLKVVDSCRQLGQEKVRFLITTRNRFSYSDDLCIEVGGLQKSDYEELLTEYCTKYSIKKPNKKQIDNIYQATDGSPLLTQSILRLCKLGDTFDSAVTEWKGQTGEDARSAAVEREILSLGIEAKRALLCIFYFDSCSKSELQQASGLPKIRLNDALIELQSLFLVNAPKFIENEDRFSISMTTKLILSELQDKLATDYKNLKKSIQQIRLGLNTQEKQGNTKRIGLAISQALSLMKEDRELEAIKTITNELQRQPKNSDLLLAHARCILQSASPNYDEARKILKQSFDNGQEKEMLFDFWYNCENSLGSIAGEIEVSRLALDKKKFSNYKWAYYLAKSLTHRSSLRNGIDRVNDLVEASMYLAISIKDSQNRNKDIHIAESYEMHNVIWSTLESDTSIDWLQSFDVMMNLISHGDIRSFTYKNAHRCIIEAESEAKTQRAKFKLNKAKERFNKTIINSHNENKNIHALMFDMGN